MNEIINYLKGKKVLILGFGREGQSTYKFLEEGFGGFSLGVADINKPGFAFPREVNLHFGEGYLESIYEYDVIIKSPGVSLKDVKLPKGEITCQTDLFLRFFPKTVIGVTGTKGKSTTSALISHVLTNCNVKNTLLGNIGIPPLSRFLDCEGICVMEISSHQLEFVKKSPNIAVLLNIYPEHLDHYKSYDHYKFAKHNIFKYQNEDDVIIYNSDCEDIDKGLISAAKSKKVAFSYKNEADIYIKDGFAYILGEKISLDEINLKIKGRHNLYNALVALCACRFAGVSIYDAVLVLDTFSGLPHRLYYCGKIDGVEYYNDSISTIPQTAICAVEALGHVDTIIVGGMDRGVDLSPLVVFLQNSGVKNVIAVPDTGYKITKALRENGADINLYDTKDLKEAVDLAKKVTPKGGVCLFSPASASYGFFKNFEDRGDAFMRYLYD